MYDKNLIVGGAVVFAVVLILLIILVTVAIRSVRREKQNPGRPPLFENDYRPGPVTRLLIRLSGYSPTEFASLGAGSHWRHSLIGLSVFVPPAMTVIGVYLWTQENGTAGPIQSWLISSFAGLVVFIIDINLMGSLTRLRGARFVSATIIATRLLLAVAMAHFIAKPYLSIIFSSAISDYYADQRNASISEIQTQKDQALIAQEERFKPFLEAFDMQIDSNKQRIDELKNEIVDLRDSARTIHREYLDEIKDGNGVREPGVGPYAKTFKSEKEKVEAEIEQKEASRNLLLAEGTRLSKERSDYLTAQFGNQLSQTAAGYEAQIQEKRKSTRSSIGDQAILLKEYVSQSPDRQAEFWIWHILLILIDTIPILAKVSFDNSDIKASIDSRSALVEKEAFCRIQLADERAQVQVQREIDYEMRFHEQQNLIDESNALYEAATFMILKDFRFRRDLWSFLKKNKIDPSEASQAEDMLNQIRDSINGRFLGMLQQIPKGGPEDGGSGPPDPEEEGAASVAGDESGEPPSVSGSDAAVRARGFGSFLSGFFKNTPPQA